MQNYELVHSRVKFIYPSEEEMGDLTFIVAERKTPVSAASSSSRSFNVLLYLLVFQVRTSSVIFGVNVLELFLEEQHCIHSSAFSVHCFQPQCSLPDMNNARLVLASIQAGCCHTWQPHCDGINPGRCINTTHNKLGIL